MSDIRVGVRPAMHVNHTIAPSDCHCGTEHWVSSPHGTGNHTIRCIHGIHFVRKYPGSHHSLVGRPPTSHDTAFRSAKDGDDWRGEDVLDIMIMIQDCSNADMLSPTKLLRFAMIVMLKVKVSSY